jgi:hypothetical protein
MRSLYIDMRCSSIIETRSECNELIYCSPVITPILPHVIWLMSGVNFSSASKINFFNVYSQCYLNIPVYRTEITAIVMLRANHSTPFYPQNLTLTSMKSGGRLVGIVR